MRQERLGDAGLIILFFFLLVELMVMEPMAFVLSLWTSILLGILYMYVFSNSSVGSCAEHTFPSRFFGAFDIVSWFPKVYPFFF